MPHLKLSLLAHKKIADLDKKLKSGRISPKKYDQMCGQIMKRDLHARTPQKLSKRGKRAHPVSDSTLSCRLGTPSPFPHGGHSDRIIGRTAWLAKKSK